MTYAYSFRPWSKPDTLHADGADILRYLEETADEYGVRGLIRLNHRVSRAAFDSSTGLWRFHSPGHEDVTASFFLNATGYFRQQEGYLPAWPGLRTFKGPVVHPQHWPGAVDIAGKQVVVIGSGATAVSLVPSLVPMVRPETGGSVTVLQRTPTDIITRNDPLSRALLVMVSAVQHWCPAALLSWLLWALRLHLALMVTLFYHGSRVFPKQVRAALHAENPLTPEEKIEHFTPPYKVWDQRVCLDKDAALLRAIKCKRVTMVTASIRRFVPDGLMICRQLPHPQGPKVEVAEEFLRADVVIAATGMQLEAFGCMEVLVDGQQIRPEDTVMHSDCFLSGLPNFAMMVGYFSQSWTLRLDVTMAYVRRALEQRRRRGAKMFVPRFDAGTNGGTDRTDSASLDFTSGYFQRAGHQLPRRGHGGAWAPTTNVFSSWWRYWRGDSDAGLVYT